MTVVEAETIQAKCLDPIGHTVYYGTFVHTPQLGELEFSARTAVGVDTEGTIVFIEKDTAEDPVTVGARRFGIPKEKVRVVSMVGLEDRFFFPGFVDTHIHAPQYPNNGIFGETTLLDWLNIYTFPLESSFKDLSLAKDVYTKVIEKTLGYGTTTAAYYATIHAEGTKLLADTALREGQRAFVGKVCMNANSPEYYSETTEESQRGTLDVIDHVQKRDPSGSLVAPIVTPRFAASCTQKLMAWLGQLREKGNYHCQTHLSENKREIAWMHELFPQYRSYTDIYFQNNLLSRRTVLAHCIHLSDEEKDLLVQTHSGVSHCPTSNSSITSGEARIRWLLNSGINVGLGTDCSGGFSPSILEVARQALLVSHHLVMTTGNDKEKLSVREVLYLATLGGANVMDIGDKVGSFEVGKKFDAQLIDLGARDSAIEIFDFQKPRWGSLEPADSNKKFNDLLCKWVFNGDDRNVLRVYVNGRPVVSKQ